MKPFSNDLIIITYSDLKRLFFRHLTQIKKAALFCALAVFMLLLLKEPHYIAEATFKQASEHGEEGSQIKEMVQQIFSQPIEGSGIAVIQSKEVLKKVIEELGMQVACKPEFFLVKAMKNMGRNMIAEWGGALPDLDVFTFCDVSYAGDLPLQLFLKVTEGGQYQLFDQKKQWIKEAKLGESLVFGSGYLTLRSIPKFARANQFYPLSIQPLYKTLAAVKNKLTIVPLKLEKTILKLTFASSDRFAGAAFLNLVMQSYQKFLKKENDEICQAQVSYLHERQTELADHFDRALLNHSIYLKENLAKNGFLGFMQEIETLSGPKNLYTSKLFDVDLELRRLSAGRELSPQIVTKIEGIKQKKQEQISNRVSKKQKKEEAENLVYLQERKNLQRDLDICDLEQKRIETVSYQPVQQEIELQPESNDFSGLSLTTAKQLLADYTRERDSLQAQIRELFFLRDQLARPDFEMSALGGAFNDSVTSDLVQKASAVALLLKDDNNRSLREQERLQETLQTQKSFLSQYLYQTIEMRKLRGALLDEKIGLLHEATLSLLQSEQSLLEAKLSELNTKMGDLPEKWHRESLLVFKKELGSMMLQGVSELLETKHLGRHIFQVNSRPLDTALPLPEPVRPKILIFTLLSAILAGGLWYLSLLCKTLLKGLPATDDNLRLSGFPVSGSLSCYCTAQLSQLGQSDLETLRRIAEFITARGTCFNCVAGKYYDYSASLAELLSLRGLKVVVIYCVFDHVVHVDAKPGLFQYLHNEIQELPLRRHLTYDYLPSGGTSRHGVELLSSQKFATLLSQMKQNYDIVLLYSDADAAKAEGQALLSSVDAAVITVQQEKKEELRVYSDWSLRKGIECVTFIYAEEV